MIKLISIVFLLGIAFNSVAQITFFGDPEPLRELNSANGENYIFLDFDNHKIFFSREKHPENTGGVKDAGDLWISEFDSGWSSPQRMDINDPNFAAPLGITPDGAYFFFSKTWYDKGLYYGGVYALPLQKDQAAFPVDLPYFKNRSPLQTGSLSRDGRYLLLSLENNLGYGVDDLFVCMLQDNGTWTAPKNLGEVVNTRLQEVSPFLAEDNKTLIFASNGHAGKGSFDLYQTTRLDETWQNWSQPVNLGAAVNTSGAETSMVFSGDSEYAYFVSTQNSDGYGDIKRIRIRADIEEASVVEEPVAMLLEQEETEPLTFVLVDRKTHVPVSGRAVVTLEDGATTVRETDNTGQVSLAGRNAVTVEFKSEGYFSTKRSLAGVAAGEQIIVSMESLETGNVITLNNVLFYRGTANFVEGSESELDLVADMMMENPEVAIFLKGHTDNVGNDVLNVQLSRERVLAVEDYLIAKGIEPGRIDGEGYGGSQPIASNEQESTRKLNRRVEFEIIRE